MQISMTTSKQSADSFATKKPLFTPRQTKQSFKERFFVRRFIYYARLPISNSFGRVIIGVGFIGVIMNTAAYLIEGPGHPLNRYSWYSKKARGELTPEQLEKERVLNAFLNQGLTPGPPRFQERKLF